MPTAAQQIDAYLLPGEKAVTRLKATQFESAGKKAAVSPEVTFAQLRDRYLKTIGNGAVENIYTLRLTQTVADAVKRVSA